MFQCQGQVGLLFLDSISCTKSWYFSVGVNIWAMMCTCVRACVYACVCASIQFFPHNLSFSGIFSWLTKNHMLSLQSYKHLPTLKYVIYWVLRNIQTFDWANCTSMLESLLIAFLGWFNCFELSYLLACNFISKKCLRLWVPICLDKPLFLSTLDG